MRKGQNKSVIYEAALGQFAKRGYKKTTLDSIANELDMTNANLYCYATSKQALYHDCIAYAMTKWQNKVYSAIKDVDDPSERLVVLCDSAVLYLSEDTVFCRILKDDPEIFPMFPTVDPYEEINNKSVAMLKDTLQKGIESGVFNELDAESCARMFFAMYKLIIIGGYIQSESEDFLEDYKSTMSVVLHGLLKN